MMQLSHGATLVGPNRTLFQLFAPDIGSVGLEIADAPARLMRAEAGGWHRLEVDCGAGTRYRYRISPDLAVPDPASRLQADDVHGPSIVVDPDAYAWRNPQWRGRPWHEAVLYELHPGAFGGFKGIAAHLPRLQELGVTAVELMPIADFFGRHNWGYDGVLPFAPDTAYGTPDELKALVDRAHDLGLMMFQDVVYNHFGPEGNYLHAYAASFFRDDIQTPWGDAIDFKNPVVRRFFIENALYWLEEYRFDGLRLDAVHAIPDRDWLEELAEAVKRTITDRAVHLVLENDNNDAPLLEGAFTAQWNDDAHHAAHVLITGEGGGYYSDYAENPASALARCLSQGFAFQGEASAYRDGARRGTPSAHLAPDRFVFFLQNHDQIGNRALGERLAAIADPDALKVGLALLLLSPQIPLLFMGEEMGAREPFLFFADYEGDLAEAVKRGRRQEFGKFPEFATEEAQRRIPDPNRAETFRRSCPSFAAADDWSRDLQDYVRQLIGLRHEILVPRLAGACSDGAEALTPRALQARWILGDGRQLSLAANFGPEPIALPPVPGRHLFSHGKGDCVCLGGKSFLAILGEPA